MTKLQELANLIFPDINDTIEDLEKRYPERNLEEGAMVTRFAPSPTGFLHTGSLFTSLVSFSFARQSKGVFYTRLEDTDTKREIAGSGEDLLVQLAKFDIVPNEGYISDTKEIGNYGPYKQSMRADIYKTVIKHLILNNRAYPCFCSSEDLSELRKEQEANKEIPGYYGKYAKCRFLSTEEQIEMIKAGKPYIIRFKSEGSHLNKVKVHDEIKGDLELTENDQDIVILKSDGLPTYHFAHLVDDHFMRTTHITRGEEWLSSLPIHLELFKTMGWEAPKYAHLPVIMKVENGNRRKLSKRKDPEAAVSFFLEQGYPKYAIIEYLLTLANSNYEAWREENMDKSYNDFMLSFDKMGIDGALFDLDKINNIAKERLAIKKATDVVNEVKEWAVEYDKEFYDRILSDEELFTKIINIDRNKAKPRKDYAKYSDIYPAINFFYNDVYELKNKEKFEWNTEKNKEDIIVILKDYIESINLDLDESSWFNTIKELADRNGYASNMKDYKKNKEAYKGSVADVSEFIRVAVTTKKNSPNLFEVLSILGKEEVIRRLNVGIENLTR